MTLPHPKHLRRMSAALTPDLGFSASSREYLKARLSKLKAKDKTVSIIMDEVHSKKTIDYSNGTVYGMDEKGELTKTLLCVMVKSVAGKYHDVVCLSPVSNLTAAKLKVIWNNAVKHNGDWF